MSHAPGISEILKRISALPTEQERQDALGYGASNSILVGTLKLMFDPNIEFDLPRGAPPYTPSEDSDNPGNYYTKFRSIHLFIKNEENDKIHRLKRETIFVQFLEALDPQDAELLIAVKDKVSPYPNITYELVFNTFPGLLPPPQEALAMIAEANKVIAADNSHSHLKKENLVEFPCPFGCLSRGGKSMYGPGPIKIHLQTKHGWSDDQVSEYKAQYLSSKSETPEVNLA